MMLKYIRLFIFVAASVSATWVAPVYAQSLQGAASGNISYAENYWALTPQEIEMRAQEDDPFAQGILALLYYWGSNGYPFDREQSNYWGTRSSQGMVTLAQQNNAVALFRIGNNYFRGLGGVEQDIDQAMAYYINSAKQGYDRAQWTLAGIYQTGGHGIAVDDEQADYWYRQALPEIQRLAQAGDYYRQGWLVQMYEEGLGGLDIDEEGASYWENARVQSMRAFFASSGQHVFSPLRALTLVMAYGDNLRDEADAYRAFVIIAITGHWVSSPLMLDLLEDANLVIADKAVAAGFFVDPERLDALVQECLVELTDECY